MIRFVLPRPMPAPPRRSNADPRRGKRAASQLALSYRLHAAIESGELRDWVEAAARIGVSRPRMSQVAALRHLSPAIQARVLAGENIHERSLRAATRFVDWTDQLAALKDKVK